ncbi:MAG: hypothetical protein OJF48_000951 [Afipia sp.]|nr:MAG: hypothetical protein OJF48_000951 [Afipia sp.]
MTQNATCTSVPLIASISEPSDIGTNSLKRCEPVSFNCPDNAAADAPRQTANTLI